MIFCQRCHTRALDVMYSARLHQPANAVFGGRIPGLSLGNASGLDAAVLRRCCEDTPARHLVAVAAGLAVVVVGCRPRRQPRQPVHRRQHAAVQPALALPEQRPRVSVNAPGHLLGLQRGQLSLIN